MIVRERQHHCWANKTGRHARTCRTIRIAYQNESIKETYLEAVLLEQAGRHVGRDIKKRVAHAKERAGHVVAEGSHREIGCEEDWSFRHKQNVGGLGQCRLQGWQRDFYIIIISGLERLL